MTWDGIERRSTVRMSDTERATWFAALEEEISDADVVARDITRMNLLKLIKNINHRPMRGTR